MKDSRNSPFKYYLTGTQIAGTVFVSVFVGYQLDKLCDNEIYFITIIISLLSIFYTLHSLIKDVNKKK
ncbi:MAG: hypothetical protein CMD23_01945 [Flavobacteriales bacterium]|nr:hypothetical protein [Flavobacteriales bacterium]